MAEHWSRRQQLTLISGFHDINANPRACHDRRQNASHIFQSEKGEVRWRRCTAAFMEGRTLGERREPSLSLLSSRGFVWLVVEGCVIVVSRQHALWAPVSDLAVFCGFTITAHPFFRRLCRFVSARCNNTDFKPLERLELKPLELNAFSFVCNDRIAVFYVPVLSSAFLF